MNNKGFSIFSLLFFAAFVAFVIFVFQAFITEVMGFSKSRSPKYYNVYKPYLVANETNKKAKLTSYDAMIKELETATKRYVNTYNPEIGQKESIVVTYGTLVDSKLIDTLYDIQNTAIACNGYTIVVNDKLDKTFTGYIKCGNNYKTNGYNINYEN